MQREKKPFVSKDVLSVEKVVDNWDKNPNEASKEIGRLMAENLRSQQLSDMPMECGLDYCQQLNQLAGVLFRSWVMKKGNEKKAEKLEKL